MMSETFSPKQFLGSRSVERSGPGFTAALRRATVPAENVPEHSHETAHFVLAIDQAYLTSANGAVEKGEPMTLVYNPPGTLHRDRFETSNGRFLSIDIAPHLTPEEVNDPCIVSGSKSRFAATRIAGCLSSGFADDLELEDLLLGVLGELRDVQRNSTYRPPWLEVAVEALMDMAGDSGLQIRDVARLVGVHPVHLARIHRQHFGCSPGAALRRQRVARAAALLPTTSLSEAALEAGFADQSHMTRAFRRDYGTTPARFRNAFD